MRGGLEHSECSSIRRNEVSPAGMAPHPDLAVDTDLPRLAAIPVDTVLDPAERPPLPNRQPTR